MERRILVPGSEWLYFKLYTGIRSADNLLTNNFFPILNRLIEHHYITEFFFIRYKDEHFHLRLRLHLSNEKNFSEVLKSFYSSFEECSLNGLLWNIQIDTYKREIERYGSNTIHIFESLFCIDSDIIIKLMTELRVSPEEDQHRWQLSLLLIDDILSMMGYNLIQKKDMMQTLSESYKQEFHFTSSTYTQQINRKYRENKSTISIILKDRINSSLKEYLSLLEERMFRMAPYAKQIINLDKKKELKTHLNSLVNSIIHMTMNRLFRSQNRLHEMVIYNFLYKYYDSVIAINKWK